MRTSILIAATVLLAGLFAAPAAPASVPLEPTEGPSACMLHFSNALPDETRFTDDGSTHLVWQDSLGRRTEAELRVGGDIVLRLPDGRVEHHAASGRLPTDEQLERIRRVLRAYRAQGVDLEQRRYVPPTYEEEPRDEHAPEGPVTDGWNNAEGVWNIVDVCEQIERAARTACTFECAQEGMTGFYTPGECGAGSSCLCAYDVHVRPF